MKNRHHKLRFIFGIVAVAVLATISYKLYNAMGPDSSFVLFLAQYGYVAALALGFIGGFHFIVPFPSIVFIPIFTHAGLNIWPVALLLALGMTAAYAVEYLFAKEAWHEMHGATIDRWTKKLHAWRRKHELLPLAGLFFYSAFFPAPNELSLPVFAGLGYKISSIITVVFLGNLVYCLVFGTGLVKIFGG